MLDIIYRYDPSRTEKYVPPATPDEARQRLEDGNRRYAHILEIDPDAENPGLPIIHFDLEDVGMTRDGSTPKQTPYAAVLGCADARVPIELIFDVGANSLFVVRVAGNVLGDECLGSFEYAVSNLGDVKLLVVLGHSRCGAVTAAVDAFLDTDRYLAIAASQPLRAILDRIFVPTRVAERSLAVVHGKQCVEQPGYRKALIETTIPLHAAFTARTLEQEFQNHKPAPPKVVFGVYDLKTRHVRVPMVGEECDCDAEVRLVAPPHSPTGITDLGVQLAGSDYVTRILAKA